LYFPGASGKPNPLLGAVVAGALMSGLASLQVYGETSIGWDDKVLPNETADDDGQPVHPSPELVKRIFAKPDPSAPARRSLSDPGVQHLRQHLQANNGLKGLEICGPKEVDRAVNLLRRDGFVVVRDVLDTAQLQHLREGTARVLRHLLTEPGPGGRKVFSESGKLAHRYGFGTCSNTRHMAHDRTWVELMDLPTTTPILTKIFGSPDYLVLGCGGELSLPGAIEYQHLHRDSPDNPDRLSRARVEQAKLLGLKPTEKLSTSKLMHEFTPPYVCVHFLTSDLTWENGPIRQIPGTHAIQQHPPAPENEPEWMKLSTLVGAPAGAAIIRDGRAWHGATPNVSREVRSMPNVEYSPTWNPGWRERFMPHELWETLSPHGRHICRDIKCEPGAWPAQAGTLHPVANRRGRQNFPSAKL